MESVIIDPQGRGVALTVEAYSLGTLMRAFRTLQGISQVDTAKGLGITQPQYSAIERGTNRMPERHIASWCALVNVEESSFRILWGSRQAEQRK